MREIKFRAWDRNKKMMRFVNLMNTFYSESGYGQTLWFNDSIQPGYADCNEADLMQSTGLHDKNGKEIYEGDIVRIDGLSYYPSGNGVFVWKEWESEPTEYSYWMKERAGWRLKTKCAQIWSEKSIEVIGNIHDNPELLK